MKEFYLKLLPIISVHSWGGLGSQLQAYSYYRYLMLKKGRKAHLVFHSAGVTFRDTKDFSSLFPNQEFLYKNDFTIDQSLKSAKITTLSGSLAFFRKLINALIKKIATKVGIVNFGEGLPTSPILPWTISVRSSYSNFPILPEVLKEINQALEDWSRKNLTSPFRGQNSSSLFCHYRLGDLIDVKTKSYIPGSQIADAFRLALETRKVDQIVILTESADEAAKILSESLSLNLHFNFDNPEILEVLNYGRLGYIFIGTNSKISFWISLLRYDLGLPKETCFMPAEICENIRNISPTKEVWAKQY